MGKIGIGHADIKGVAENWPSENVQKLNRTEGLEQILHRRALLPVHCSSRAAFCKLTCGNQGWPYSCSIALMI